MPNQYCVTGVANHASLYILLNRIYVTTVDTPDSNQARLQYTDSTEHKVYMPHGGGEHVFY